MSYVLHALRKSAPDGRLASAHAAGMLGPVRVERGRRAGPSAPLMGAAALAVFAVVAFGWIGSRHSASDAAGQPASAGSAAPAAQAGAVAPLTLSLSMAETASIPAQRPATAAAHEDSASRRAAAQPAPQTAAATAAPAPAAAGAELPAALRKELPKLAISGYILDEHTGSLAIIDDKVLRVGDEAAPGLRIEKIDRDGVAFSYRGYRFRR